MWVLLSSRVALGHRTGGAVAGHDLGQKCCSGPQQRRQGHPRWKKLPLLLSAACQVIIDLVLRNIGRVLCHPDRGDWASCSGCRWPD